MRKQENNQRKRFYKYLNVKYSFSKSPNWAAFVVILCVKVISISTAPTWIILENQPDNRWNAYEIYFPKLLKKIRLSFSIAKFGEFGETLVTAQF